MHHPYDLQNKSLHSIVMLNKVFKRKHIKIFCVKKRR